MKYLNPSLCISLILFSQTGDALEITPVNNNASLFCQGGCTLTVNGQILTQGEVFAGLAVKF